MTQELAVLQAARLRGRLSSEVTASACGIDCDSATALLEVLCEAGYLQGDTVIRLTAEGRVRLAELVKTERDGVDQRQLANLYEEFDRHNGDFKQLVSEWQIKDGCPNDHGDQRYDSSVIARLDTLDAGFQPLVERIALLAPRLQTYRARFTNALSRIQQGDTSFIARPITDSYHTVWFEFHEELIGLLGLSRDQEAAAGRAV